MRGAGLEQLVVACVLGFGLLQVIVKLLLQRLALVLQLCRSPRAAAAIVRADPRAVVAQPLERCHAQLPRQLHQLHEQVFELRGILAAELAERRVVDRPAAGQPAKIQPHDQGLFQAATAANSRQQPVQDDACHHPRMNRRLPKPLVILPLPCRPIHLAKHVIEHPHAMPARQRLIQPLRKQHHLIPLLRRLVPSHQLPPSHTTPRAI